MRLCPPAAWVPENKKISEERRDELRAITEHEVTEGGKFFGGPKAPRKMARPSAEPSNTEFLRAEGPQKFRSEILQNTSTYSSGTVDFTDPPKELKSEVQKL